MGYYIATRRSLSRTSLLFFFACRDGGPPRSISIANSLSFPSSVVGGDRGCLRSSLAGGRRIRQRPAGGARAVRGRASAAGAVGGRPGPSPWRGGRCAGGGPPLHGGSLARPRRWWGRMPRRRTGALSAKRRPGAEAAGSPPRGGAGGGR